MCGKCDPTSQGATFTKLPQCRPAGFAFPRRRTNITRHRFYCFPSSIPLASYTHSLSLSFPQPLSLVSSPIHTPSRRNGRRRRSPQEQVVGRSLTDHASLHLMLPLSIDTPSSSHRPWTSLQMASRLLVTGRASLRLVPPSITSPSLSQYPHYPPL